MTHDRAKPVLAPSPPVRWYHEDGTICTHVIDPPSVRGPFDYADPVRIEFGRPLFCSDRQLLTRREVAT